MPHFYFPSWEGDHFAPDEVGLDLPSLAEARLLAAQTLGEMARDILCRPSGGLVLRMDVTEGGPAPLAKLRLTYEVR